MIYENDLCVQCKYPGTDNNFIYVLLVSTRNTKVANNKVALTGSIAHAALTDSLIYDNCKQLI